MAGGVEGGDGGAHGDGLADPDVADDHPEGGLGDAMADAGHGLTMGRSGVEVGCGDGLGERGAGEPEVRDPRGPAHVPTSSSKRGTSA